jgi:indolepyruvate ferredoxin oxidoreductase, beta subunit
MDTTAQRPITIAILAMGGEGGGVLAEWIVDVAEHAGYIAQMTSVPGVAQRTGATNYYVELFPKHGAKANSPAPVLGLTAMPGDVDIVIASELMEAGRAVQRGLVTPDRTTFIVSTNRVYAMTEKIAMADGRVDSDALLEGCKAAAKRIIHGDMAQLAEATGSVISAVLFGALAGARVLPMQRTAFEAAIHRGGVGVKASIAAFGAGFAAAEGGPLPVKAETPVVKHISAALAPLMAVASSFPEPARMFVRFGVERLADYQDTAYARDYLDRLKPIAEIEKQHGGGTGQLLAETARELALGMAYEDTVRVAELKIRPSRFERVRAEVQAEDGQIVEIAEFFSPRVQEIADTLPAGLGRWLLNTGWARGFVQRFTKSRVVKTSSIGGFLMLYCIASLKPTRRRSLRFANEQAFLREWLQTIETVAATNYALATEIATTRTLVKGYSDTHERGRQRYDLLMQLLPRLMETPDPAAALATLRKAALADETGAALNVAIRDVRPLPQAAE